MQRRAGSWILGESLGRGGMAEVFAATNASGAPAAVKVLHADVAADPELLARFWREIEIAAEIGHLGVVRVFDHGLADDGRPFVAMERLIGKTLADLAREPGALLPSRLVNYARQALDVLAFAHDRGVIHRDLKPANLFVTTEGQVKVLDFGIARLLEWQPDNLRTATGVALGTVSYMAPEQAAGLRDRVDARTDLFAIGAILFRLLAGRRIHEAGNQAALLLKMAAEPAPPITSVAPSVPATLARVIDRALAYDRQNRFVDARSMSAALAEAERAMGGSAPLPYRPSEPTSHADPTVISAGVSAGSLAPFAAAPPTTAPAPRASGTPPSLGRAMIATAIIVAVVGSLGMLGSVLMLFVIPGAPAGPSANEKAVDLAAFLAEYRSNAGQAQTRNYAKHIRVTGEVQRVSNEGILLGGDDPPFLSCDLDNATTFRAGERVTVHGRVGMRRASLGVIPLERCSVVP